MRTKLRWRLKGTTTMSKQQHRKYVDPYATVITGPALARRGGDPDALADCFLKPREKSADDYQDQIKTDSVVPQRDNRYAYDRQQRVQLEVAPFERPRGHL